MFLVNEVVITVIKLDLTASFLPRLQAMASSVPMAADEATIIADLVEGRENFGNALKELIPSDDKDLLHVMAIGLLVETLSDNGSRYSNAIIRARDAEQASLIKDKDGLIALYDELIKAKDDLISKRESEIVHLGDSADAYLERAKKAEKHYKRLEAEYKDYRKAVEALSKPLMELAGGDQGAGTKKKR